jgi:cytochrome c oxidase assembly factor CtaG
MSHPVSLPPGGGTPSIFEPWGSWGPWHWYPTVGLSLMGLAAVYTVGWWRLRRRGHARAAGLWRLAAYLTGLASVALALLSPVDHLAEVLFTAHMIQHQLLLMVGAPLVLLGNPLPFVLWGVPRGLRLAIGATLVRQGVLRRALSTLTWMPVAGILYAATLWGWHVPAAYEAALGSEWMHDLEHLAFFGTAVLFWWPVIAPAPRFEAPRGGLYYGLRIGYLVLAAAQNTLLGALIGLTERVLYPSYATAPRLFGLTALDDQALGGGIMWSGGHMYLIAILVLVGQAMNQDARDTPAEATDAQR